MKLLLCKKCQDVVRLIDDTRRCQCGGIGGYYLDDVNAVYWGRHAVTMGFDNSSLRTAIMDQPVRAEQGIRFTAFVIPRVCLTFKRIRRPKGEEHEQKPVVHSDGHGMEPASPD